MNVRLVETCSDDQRHRWRHVVGQEVYREHLRMVGELYDLRQRWLCGWEATLDDLAEVEARIDGQLRAFGCGGDGALGVALMEAVPEDSWSFYALVALACRLHRFAIVRVALSEVEVYCEASTDERAAASLRQAVADALVHHLASDAAELVAEALRDAGPHVASVLATCVGARGWIRAADELREAAGRACADRAAVLRALGQLPGTVPGAVLAEVRCGDPVVAQAAAVAALRCGEASVLDRLARRKRAPWAALPVAMGGGPATGAWLMEAARGEEPAQALLGLGVFGDPRGLEVLVEQLRTGAHAEAAALGLFMITGARLKTEDDAEHEAIVERACDRAWTALDGSGISIDPVVWERWLAEHGERLRPGQRYRLGRLAGPHTDLEVLSMGLPLWLRRCLADEFVIRYGVQWSYEPDLPVVQQREIIEQVRSRLDDPRMRFVDGEWYLHGRLAPVGESVEWKDAGRRVKA
ncbi:hypothetical protein [Paraliomyxa miuraensis]|uniref:hypothetical protein n=1 Tax=Paraliomyxa miuraensis TaxID=376150 RepID=UPI0022599CCA|nr:hypothetical protein [Paraliomyxa miuraensis]MCX4240173.1 hypothetical protein [Paraliomyxa miuraensis]